MTAPAAPPPRIEPDPDARLLRWGWTLFAAWTLLGGTLTLRELQTGDYGLIGVVLVAPFWAAWLMWLLWRAAVRVAPWFGYRPHYRYHGSYYEFDGRQVRVWFDETRAWVAADDVLDVLGLEGVARDVERLRSLAGPDAVQRLDGVRGWLFTDEGLALWLARRGGATAHRLAQWFDSQVLAPHRRRRERAAAPPPSP